MEPRDAYVLLAIFSEPADERVGQVVAEFGPVEALAKFKTGAGGNSLAKKLNSANYISELKAVDKFLADTDVSLLTPQDFLWPTKLNDLDFARPHCLWLKGDLQTLVSTSDSVAVVGARAATTYGERIAAEIGSTLGEWSVTSISGAAFGIDAAVHRGTISAGGQTIAVLACGVDIYYPTAHRALIDRICQSGIVISESPPGSPPYKQRFLTRNRIIAALSKDVVVVEAALRSGSLSTANWANVIGRKVWGVPGPITSATSAGVHLGLRRHTMEILMEPFDLVAPLINQ